MQSAYNSRVHRLSILIALAAQVLVLALVALLALLFFMRSTMAHDATNTQGQPLGWDYPWSCCSKMDCGPIDASRVHKTPEGYVIDGSTDESPIPYGDKRIKDSPDGNYHWCAHKAGIGIGKTICFYRGPEGY